MQTQIRRLVSVAASAAALSAVPIAPAHAASGPSAVTSVATSVGGSLATLNALVNPAGNQAYYEFVYGTTTSYGQHTAVQSIAAGQSASQSVSALITGLSPGTTYHYELVVETVSGGYYGTPIAGGDRTFTTFKSRQVGSLKLLSKRLTVRHGKITISFRCASSRACKGTVGVKAGHSRCVAGKRFSIGAGGHKKLKAPVRGACVTLLQSAKHHRSGAKLTASMSTVQPSLSKGVMLVLR